MVLHISIIQHALKYKSLRLLRLWVMLKCISNQGWYVHFDDYGALIETVSKLLSVNRRSARNLLNDTQRKGLINIVKDKNRVYLCSAKKYAEIECVEVEGRNSVKISLDDIAGLDVVGFRAFLLDAFLSAQPENNISRKKMRELLGVTRKTQYKYEKMRPIEKQSTFIVAGDEDDELLKKVRRTYGNGFVTEVEDLGSKVVFQTANCYFGSIARRRSRLDTKTRSVSGTRTRYFWDNVTRIARGQDCFIHYEPKIDRLGYRIMDSFGLKLVGKEWA